MSHLRSILSSPTTRRPAALLGAFVAAVPLLSALAILVVGARTLGHPMFPEPATAVGIPLGLVITGFGVAWGAIGGWIVGTARSRWVLPYALMFFTLPALFVLLFGPALVLIVQNAG